MVWVALLVFIGVLGFGVVVAIASAGRTTAPPPPVFIPTSQSFIDQYRKSVLFSTIPWINRHLQRLELAPRLRMLLFQAGLKLTVGGLMLMSGLCFAGAAYLTYLRTRNIPFAIGVGFLLSVVPLGVVLYKRHRRFNKFEEMLPEALDLIVNAVRVGQSLNAALGLAGRESPEPVGGELRTCFDEQNYGLELRAAMENLVVRVPLQDLRMVVTGIMIQKESGGNLAEILEKTASVIRERFRIKRQIKTHTAQGRLTGWILTLLPVGLGFVLYFINPGLMSILWTRELGRELMWASAGALLVGTIWIQKIIRIDV
jgi:tight adherence protein B